VVVSALLMLRRVARAVRYAIREEDFIPVVIAGAALVLIGTGTYALGQGWNVIDALYFAVATLTTTSVADPDLVLHSRWLKVFTVLYLLVGIGILVEILRRLGFAFVTVRTQERKAHLARLRGENQESQPGGRARE
jgi:Na+/H+ antiporter NhaD/arsenite permease-like protein